MTEKSLGKKLVPTTRKLMQYKSAQGWRTIGDKKCYFRSKWEANFARYLECCKQNGAIHDWEYEPQTFWFEGIKRGVCSYKPDFKRYNSETQWDWIEVKGHMDNRSITKIKRFKKYYPKEILLVYDGEWFSDYHNILKRIPGYEE